MSVSWFTFSFLSDTRSGTRLITTNDKSKYRTVEKTRITRTWTKIIIIMTQDKKYKDHK